MNKLAVCIILLIIILASISLIFSLFYSPQEKSPLFLEFWDHVDGKILEGSARKLMIDFPAYKFDSDKKELSGFMNFDANASCILILGMGHSLSGDAGEGVSSKLLAIDKLPFHSDSIKILKVENGKIYLSYEGVNITLKPGDEWERIREYVRFEDGSKIKFTERIKIRNHGYVKLRPQP